MPPGGSIKDRVVPHILRNAHQTSSGTRIREPVQPIGCRRRTRLKNSEEIELALTLIDPVIVNILLFHLLMNASDIVPDIIATVCWLVVFYSVRPAFAGILRHQVQETIK